MIIRFVFLVVHQNHMGGRSEKIQLLDLNPDIWILLV